MVLKLKNTSQEFFFGRKEGNSSLPNVSVSCTTRNSASALSISSKCTDMIKILLLAKMCVSIRSYCVALI